jgi:tetratricopeptide (TPR) repeat protein
MPDNPRIEDLRRRVQKDPASIAFAQLAEEYRRAGQSQEAVDACRTGLAVHPGYLSARVTLGRALVELGQLDEAQTELETVLKNAAENLAAIRGLAEIHHRRGALSEALSYYRAALSLARNDPDLEQTVNDLARQLAPSRSSEPQDGLSLDEMQREMAALVPPGPPPAKSAAPPPTPPPVAAARPEPQADPERGRALHTIAALDQWLAAIHAARADRHA